MIIKERKMDSNKTKPNVSQNQHGMVAIIVTLIIMLILSLIVIGFAKLTRREQRQTLDKQLETQAFYAAESGVNDTAKALTDYYANNPGVSVPAKTSCDNGTAPWNTLSPDLELDQSVQYTCVLVNPNPPEIKFDEVDADSKVAPLNTSDGSAFTVIRITWRNSDSSVPNAINNACGGNNAAPDFSTFSGWRCSVGLLRIDLVPTPSTGFSRAALLSNLMTAFIYPAQAGDPALNFSSSAGANQGAIVHGTCAGSPVVCQADIDVSAQGQASYMFRVRSLYQPSQLTISSVGKTFSGAQAVIDVTGRAQDVLRRIQVRKPLGVFTNPLLADYTIESNNICKRYDYLPGGSGSVTNNGGVDCSIP